MVINLNVVKIQKVARNAILQHLYNHKFLGASLSLHETACLLPYHTLSRYENGGYLFLTSYIMRTRGSKKQQDVMKNVGRKQMRKVFEVLHIIFISIFITMKGLRMLLLVISHFRFVSH